MSVTYNRSDTFLGVPFTSFRNVLLRWNKSRCIGTFFNGAEMLEEATCAVLIDEAEAQGLFDYFQEHSCVEYGPTEAGLAVLSASPLLPITTAKAQSILDDLLERAGKVNDRDDLHFTVDQIWLYGSHAKGSEKVNDIDLVIQTGRTEKWALGGPAGREIVAKAKGMGAGCSVTNACDSKWNSMKFIENRLLFGERRNPRISVGDINTLQMLGCECRLLFDRSRGGPVDDPLLAKHPNSKGRDKDMESKRVMPNLNRRGSLKPTSCDLAKLGSDRLRDCHPRENNGWRYLRYNVLMGREIARKFVSEQLKEWLNSFPECDDREMSVVVLGKDHKTGTYSEVQTHPIAFASDRSIDQEGGGYRIAFDIRDVWIDMDDAPDEDDIYTLECAVIGMLACDTEKVVRHSPDEGPDFVEFSVTASSGDKVSRRVAKTVRAAVSNLTPQFLTDEGVRKLDGKEIRVNVATPEGANRNHRR